MALEITERAKALLADKGYDPVYGARPLKRTIQRLIQDPLAVKILAGEFKEGDRVKVDSQGERTHFHSWSGGRGRNERAKDAPLNASPKRIPLGLARVRKDFRRPGKSLKAKKPISGSGQKKNFAGS